MLKCAKIAPALINFDGSRGFGMNRAFFKRNIYLVADGGQRLADGAGRNLKYGSGVNSNRGQAPGLEVFLDVDDDSVAVEVDGVDWKTHGEGVNAVGGANPQALAARETGRIGSHQAAKAGPVGACDHEIGREIGGAGTVKGVSLGPSH